MNLKMVHILNVNINSGDSMKKKIIIVLIVLVLVLVTGCENNKNKEDKYKNQKTLTCTKINPGALDLGSRDINYIIDSTDTYIYSDDVLKDGKMIETYDFSRYLHSRSSYRSDYVNLYKVLFDAYECSTDYFSNVEALSGSVKECNKEWGDDTFSRIYTMDTEILKDRDDFKTIKKAKDFYEKNLFKCKIK